MNLGLLIVAALVVANILVLLKLRDLQASIEPAVGTISKAGGLLGLFG